MLYETEDDRIRESDVAEEFAEALGYSANARMGGTTALVDREFYLEGGELGAVAEIKTRTNIKKKYTEYFVDKAKWDAVIEASELLNVPGYLVVRWEDALGWMVPSRELEAHLRVGIRGRYDRNDVNDEDFVIYIPVKLFQTRKVHMRVEPDVEWIP